MRNVQFKKALGSAFIAIVLVVTGCSSSSKDSNEKKASIYYSHGTSNLVAKDYTNALKYLTQAVQLEPDDSRIHNNLGMAYYFKKSVTKAIFHLEKAIELDGKNSDARNNLASIYLQLGQIDKARNQYLIVLNDLVYQHQYRTLYNLALLDIRQNRLASAFDYLQKSIKDKEDYCPSHYQLGLIERRRKDYKKSLEYFTEGTKGTCYEQPAPLYQQALAYEYIGEYDTAVNKLENIITRFPTSRFAAMSQTRINMIKRTSDSEKEASNTIVVPRKKKTKNRDKIFNKPVEPLNF